MVTSANRGLIYRFGVYEVMVEARELLRQGRRIRMQQQPFELLLLLLENAGEIVDRESLRLRLWPADTFVDFGQSLSAAVTKLRQALGDDSANPRFIETVPRRGYRFIAPVARHNEPIAAPDPAPHVETVAAPLEAYTKDSLDERRPQAARHGATPKMAWLSLAVAVLLAAALGIYLHQRKPAFRLAASDTIVLADFENNTGETVFNDALRQALLVGLAQSPLIQILPDRATAVVFRQMGHSPDDRITGLTALDLCRRLGSKAAVQGSISSLGTTYLIGLAAIRCDTGKPIAYEQIEAPQRNDVIDALGQVTSRLRERLGESMPTLKKYNAPLEQATTSSLEALNAYGKALSVWDAKGDRASIPYFQKAIELDPEFAMAYGALAVVYNNTGNFELARENSVKAYNLRERVTSSERASVEARYYLYVTEEVDKAALSYAALARDYPQSAGSLNHLGTTDLRLGKNEQAAEDFRQAMLIDPGRANTYGNLALALLRLNRLKEVQAVLAEASRRGFRTGYWLMLNYWLAILNHDQAEMDRSVAQSSDFAGGRAALLAEAANKEAADGHFEKARALSKSADDLLQAAGDKEGVARVLMRAALRESEAGFFARARVLSRQAESLSHDKIIVISNALISAQLGDYAQASTLSGQLDEQYPHGTFVQKFWLPMIRGEVELRQGRGAKAAALLSSAEPLDPSVVDGFISPLQPVYVLGQAWLVDGDGAKAAAAFGQLTEHPGMLLNSSLGALAVLGQARAYSLSGRPVEAAKAYQQFLATWKDADPDIPILQQARREAERAQRAAAHSSPGQ